MGNQAVMRLMRAQTAAQESEARGSEPKCPAQSRRLQREIEVRPPGRGEGSAFERREELIKRLNDQSPAIQYRLEGRTIRCVVIDEATLTHFDRQMQGFIDRPELVPMRLTTGANLVADEEGDFMPMMLDSFSEAYLDLDDLLGDDDFSFQLDLVHILTERFAARNYAHRIGIPKEEPGAFSVAEANHAHEKGLDAETSLLADFFNDPSIEFNYQEDDVGRGTAVFNFRSRRHGYQIFHVIVGTGREITRGETFVRTRDGRRVTMDAFRAERAQAGSAR